MKKRLRIAIIGCGDVGLTALHKLKFAGHDIQAIDEIDKTTVENFDVVVNAKEEPKPFIIESIKVAHEELDHSLFRESNRPHKHKSKRPYHN